MSSVYLTHEVMQGQGPEDWLQSSDWRAIAMTKLHRVGISVINPIELAQHFVEEQENARKSVKRALELIDQSDAVLANLINSSVGTAMEIFYAHRRGKPVTVIGSSPFSPWVLSHSRAQFEDVEEAVDFLVGEHLSTDFLSWSLHYEKLLSERYEEYPPSGESDFVFTGGILPVLLMAPRATSYFREGEFIEPDVFTGSMCATIQKYSRSHSLISSYCVVADPMRYTDTPLIRTVSEAARAGQVGCVIMLLGLGRHESPGLQIEYNNAETACDCKNANRLKDKLSQLDTVSLTNISEDLRPFANYLDEVLSVPLVVIKTHRRYRMPRLQPELFLFLIKLVSEFAREVGIGLNQDMRQ